ncbi:MAG: polysaccharide biosynthesis/export family protein [Chitinophagaceae bacterium]|nr:polysaccharide biosynthesis/export family protein [Chitinophagaceae bacterium]
MKTGLVNARKKFVVLLVLGLSLIFGACVDSKPLKYFPDLAEGVIPNSIANLEPVLAKGDILSISVTSPNPDATVMFNAPNMAANQTTAAAGNIAPSSGYLISQDGFIEFPALGKITASGLTKQKLKEDITQRLTDSKLLIDPIVTIRLLNYRVTVLGEVTRPTVVTVPNEKISILEAIGLAGDITIYGKKDNVLLIREEKGGKVVKRLNLNSSEILSSPYYYLKSNDVVYVEPNNAKAASSSRSQQLLPTILSGLSFIAIILTRVIN